MMPWEGLHSTSPELLVTSQALGTTHALSQVPAGSPAQPSASSYGRKGLWEGLKGLAAACDHQITLSCAWPGCTWKSQLEQFLHRQEQVVFVPLGYSKNFVRCVGERRGTRTSSMTPLGMQN